MAKIAVDLDGVCYEWDRTARYMLRNMRGQHHLESESVSWYSIRDSIPKEEWQWLWNEGVELGLFRYGHMTTGARVGMQALADAGHALTIVTHRPSTAILDTNEWVTMYFKDIPLAGYYILPNGEPKTQVNCDILIDDKPENIEQWYDSGRTAIIFDRPWNSEVTEIVSYEPIAHPQTIRARGWKEVVDVVQRLSA